MRRGTSKYRVLVLLDERLIPPESLDGHDAKEIENWRMEFDVLSTLKQQGHEVRALGIMHDLGVLRTAIDEFKPHVAFNLLEEFSGSPALMQNVIGYLELLGVPFTGCNPRGLMLAKDKALSKKILAYHRIPIPQFAVFPNKKRIRRGLRLQYPLLVKSTTTEGSVGISQASVVGDEDKLLERVEFIHRTLGTHAIAEQYIEGREFYVGVIGNSRLETFPPWELLLKHLPEGAPNIATLKVKWDLAYQMKVGVVTEEAKDLSIEQLAMISRASKRIYKMLELSGYARLDFRMRQDGRIFLIEANPNPNLREDEDYAQSAKAAGVSFSELISRILQVGISYEYVPLP